MIKYGESKVDNFKFGDQQIAKVAVGTGIIWENYVPSTVAITGSGNIPTYDVSSYDSGKKYFGKTIRHITSGTFSGSLAEAQAVDGSATLQLIKEDDTLVSVASGSVSGGPSIYSFSKSFTTDATTPYIGYRLTANKNKTFGSAFNFSFRISAYEQKGS